MSNNASNKAGLKRKSCKSVNANQLVIPSCLLTKGNKQISEETIMELGQRRIGLIFKANMFHKRKIMGFEVDRDKVNQIRKEILDINSRINREISNIEKES